MVDMRLIAFSLAALGVASFGLASCASPDLYTGAGAGMHRFSQLGRPKPLADAPSAAEASPVRGLKAPARLASAAPAQASMSSARGPAALDEARRRVIALLSAQGFMPEVDVGGEAISASRMATASEGAHDAVCGVRALSRPRMYAANVDIRLSPGAGGVAVGVDARFEEMDQNLVSGELSKHACVSRGVLEAQVRRAAAGG
jgi:hypothetical protein